MLGAIILVVGLVVFWFMGIKKKNGAAAAIGIIMVLAAFHAWFPNFFPALVTLVMTIGEAVGTFFSTAFNQ